MASTQTIPAEPDVDHGRVQDHVLECGAYNAVASATLVERTSRNGLDLDGAILGRVPGHGPPGLLRDVRLVVGETILRRGGRK
jgi:hypothetical protein